MKREDIDALTLDPKVKADLFGLFDKITTQETALEDLRKKVPTSSQKVVEGVDHEKFLAATAELQRLKDEMASKIGNKGGEEGEAFLSAFAPFFS